jgi:hypothetical protein
MLQCLCGPARHAIYGFMYDDQKMSPEDVLAGAEALIEEMIVTGQIRRRCEICDKDIVQFAYEDGRTIEQDWDKAKAISMRLGAEQMRTRLAVMAARKAGKN